MLVQERGLRQFDLAPGAYLEAAGLFKRLPHTLVEGNWNVVGDQLCRVGLKVGVNLRDLPGLAILHEADRDADGQVANDVVLSTVLLRSVPAVPAF